MMLIINYFFIIELMTDNQDKIPTLLMMLEYNKFQDVLKAMVNKKISALLL